MPVPKSEYISDIWREGSFDGRVVFCTGGAGSICSAQVRALVYLGANACIIGRNVEKTQSMAADIATARPGAKVIGVGDVDVRKPESVKASVTKCVEELGGIDIAISGAAGNFLAPVNAVSENAFKSVMDIDVLGSYNMVKAVLPYIHKSAAQAKETGKPGPRLLFVSATRHYAADLYQVHVNSAKAAIDALSASLSIELGPLGITSNVIAPGAVKGTEGMERLAPKDMNKDLERRWPLGRWATVKDVADATVWLSSEAANYISGTIVVVDGSSWRMGIGGGSFGGKMQYPDFLLSGKEITGVKGEKKSKL